MKKSFLLSGALLLSISAFTANAQQLPNVGFDSWKTSLRNIRSISKDGKKVDVARPGVEPSEWNGSNVNQMGQKKPDLVTKVVDNSNDNSNTVVQVKNIYVGVNLGLIKIGSTAPGFINLGTPWVYASTTISDCDGGVFGGISFDKKPDAIKGKYKRTDSNSEDSHIIAYLWNGTYTSKIGNVAQTVTEEQNNVDRVVLGKATGSASGKLVASCDKAFSSTANKDWETIVVPLDYLANAGNPTMMNVIISAGDYWNRGNLKENTTLLVDDVDFVYYSTLTSLTVGGETIALQEGVYNYNLKTDMPSVSKEDVVAVCKSQFANADVTIDNVNKQIKIVVTNQGGKDTDGATSHTYTLQYPVETTYQGYLNVKRWVMVISLEMMHTILP